MSAEIAIHRPLLLHWQKDQEAHDRDFHADIFYLPLKDRMNHMTLHFSKYLSRFCRNGLQINDTNRKTVTDTALIALSAANALRMNLSLQMPPVVPALIETDIIIRLATPNGDLANAIEKMDHLEQDGPQMQVAMQEIFAWVLAAAEYYRIELNEALAHRRQLIRESRQHIGRRAIY